ncbi:uncharacterized protein G2W53_000914 [Senna tora]|uniref:Uncharacterized protein n=1 Tax=Senna tora TaxID=362788 RepID=A0A834XGM8_9FABA|nr:uncharacterized protein G2W53_000914 [Senna tora]
MSEPRVYSVDFVMWVPVSKRAEPQNSISSPSLRDDLPHMDEAGEMLPVLRIFPGSFLVRPRNSMFHKRVDLVASSEGPSGVDQPFGARQTVTSVFVSSPSSVVRGKEDASPSGGG